MTTADAQPLTEPPATLERIGPVAVITLNRPHVMNAVNAAMSVAVQEAIDELCSDPELRVGILRGAGRAFSVGADLKEVAAGRPLQTREQRERGWGGFMRQPIDKPLIAAVHGFALGGGTEMMLSCDLAVVSETARLGLPEVQRGIIAAGGGLLRLPRRVPLAVALEAALTGDQMSAQDALHWGLVNRVVPEDQVFVSALELAEKIAANAPLAVQASKRVIHQSIASGSDWAPDAWRLSDLAAREVMTSEDAKEGPRAFAQKRAPRWEGK